MLSDKQIESNRRRAENSCGPRTPEGKRISSQNSFKTGLYAQSLIIQGEKREDFETLQNEYYTHYQPQSPAERDLLDTMIRLVWQQRRYAHVEAELWDWEVYDQTSRGSISRHYPLGDMFSQCGDKFSRLQRMQNAAQTKFKDALHDLQRLQAARPAQSVEKETTAAAPGFVPSTCEAGPSAPPPGFGPPQSAEPQESPGPVAPAASAASADPEFVPPTPASHTPGSWFDPSTIWVHPPYEDPCQPMQYPSVLNPHAGQEETESCRGR